MYKIPKEHIVQKIAREKNVSLEEIESKIQRKLKELAGLISEEGAAHIIANEYGVQLFDTDTSDPITITQIFPGMRRVTTHVKVIKKYPVTHFERNGTPGRVQSLYLGDSTGTIRSSFWNDAVDLLNDIQEQDILTIENTVARENQGRVELWCSEQTKLTRNPDGIVIKDVVITSTSKLMFIKDIDESTQNASVMATLVQLYPPAFFAPKSVRDQGVTITDEQKTGALLSGILDDGTATIRFVMYTENVTAFTQRTVTELKEPEAFEQLKKEFLGSLVHVDGKIQKNKRNDALEITAQNISIVDEQQIITNLEKLKKNN